MHLPHNSWLYSFKQANVLLWTLWTNPKSLDLFNRYLIQCLRPQLSPPPDPPSTFPRGFAPRHCQIFCRDFCQRHSGRWTCHPPPPLDSFSGPFWQIPDCVRVDRLKVVHVSFCAGAGFFEKPWFRLYSSYCHFKRFFLQEESLGHSYLIRTFRCDMSSSDMWIKWCKQEGSFIKPSLDLVIRSAHISVSSRQRCGWCHCVCVCLYVRVWSADRHHVSKRKKVIRIS